MLLYRGALVYAEDRNHDTRSGLSPVEVEHLKYVVFGGNDAPPEMLLAHRDKLPAETHSTVAVSPQVSLGRWVIPCPWCFSASMASRDDHRFFCVECQNAGAQGKWVRVEWPESKNEIEALMVMRPNPRNRHWLPHETVADLLAENAAHGVV